MRRWNRGKEFDFTLHEWGIPTREDVLDVNFWAIVSDCRAIVGGTLVPRSWADISSTWSEELVINHGRYKVVEPGAIAPHKLRTTKQVSGHLINRMAYILEKNGMDKWDAKLMAAKLLTKKETK